MSAENLAEKVIVITGASSGIGRASALLFAEKGARVVLAARDEEALEDVRAEVRDHGANAITVVCDVSEEDQVEALANTAIKHFGRIDVWVNNAGVGIFGRAEDVPAEDVRRLIDVNVLGVIYGSQAALRHFLKRGTGSIINVASVLGKVGSPYMSAYAASKHAVVGFSESLRMELVDYPEINVTTIMPAAMNTEFFESSVNYTGRAVKAQNPVYSPFRVGRAIVSAASDPAREVPVGGSAKQMIAMHTAMPLGMTEKMVANQTETHTFTDESSTDSRGNLFEPNPGPRGAKAGWTEDGERSHKAAIAVGGLVVIGLAAAAFIYYRGDRSPSLASTSRNLLKQGRVAVASGAALGIAGAQRIAAHANHLLDAQGAVNSSFQNIISSIKSARVGRNSKLI
ncbi:hypothetical protein BH09SUM1_BH09SUM1_34250 [soil metagenome]